MNFGFKKKDDKLKETELKNITKKISIYAHQLLSKDLEMLHNNMDLTKEQKTSLTNFESLCKKLLTKEEKEIKISKIEPKFKEKLILIIHEIQESTKKLIKFINNENTKEADNLIEEYFQKIEELLELESELNI